MQEMKQGDARIYIISTLFFVCISAGGVFICLYILQPEDKSTPWYPIAGIVLIAIPWIFWIATYIYRCFVLCFPVSNVGMNVNRELSSLTKKQSCSYEGRVGRSMHSAEDESLPSESPDGKHRQVRFGDVVVLGSREYNQDKHGGESPHEDAHCFFVMEHESEENSHGDDIASYVDHISVAAQKGEEQLIMSDST